MKKAILFLLLACFSGAQISAQVVKTPNTQKKWAWLDFERPVGINPLLAPNAESTFYCSMRENTVKWESADTFNPAATVINGQIVVLYRAEDDATKGLGMRTSRIGYASSNDGIHFQRHGAPVMFPGKDAQADAENGGGCEDPRVCMTEDGTYVMMYTQWNRKCARLGVATSRDLVNWTKHGSPFHRAYGGKFENMFSKSASIVTKIDKQGRQIIAKINGKYWMYWGEQYVNVATSEDLINWTPEVDENGEIKKTILPRPGYFDSMLTECGPPAIMTNDGIILFYNGKNDALNGDKTYTANTYCAGQILFDKKNPYKVLDRLDDPFYKPEADFEKSGQYPAGTVFIEGLVPFKGKWYLYYGCADSFVAVAVRDHM